MGASFLGAQSHLEGWRVDLGGKTDNTQLSILSPDFRLGCLVCKKQIHSWLLQGEAGDGTGTSEVGMQGDVEFMKIPYKAPQGDCVDAMWVAGGTADLPGPSPSLARPLVSGGIGDGIWACAKSAAGLCTICNAYGHPLKVKSNACPFQQAKQHQALGEKAHSFLHPYPNPQPEKTSIHGLCIAFLPLLCAHSNI